MRRKISIFPESHSFPLFLSYHSVAFSVGRLFDALALNRNETKDCILQREIYFVFKEKAGDRKDKREVVRYVKSKLRQISECPDVSSLPFIQRIPS